MAVVVGRMLAVLEAQTAAFDARMDAAAQRVNRFNSATGSAGRGIALLRGGIQQLAIQATGAGGAVGHLATGLLTIGAGAGPALIAAAGIGAVVGAVRLLTTSTRESIKAQEAMIESLAKLGAAGQATSARLRIGQLEAIRDTPGLWERLKSIPGAFLGDITGGAAGTTFEERRELINREIARLRGVIGGAGPGIKAQEAKAADARLEAIRQRTLARVIPDRGEFVAMGEQLFSRDQARMREKLFIDITRMEADRFRFAKPAVEPADEPKEPFRFTPEFGVMSAAALLQGAQGGGAGLFGAAAGPLAMINPLAGAISAGIGGIFSLFNNDEERRHRQLVDTIKQMGQDVGLDRVTVVFTGPDGHQVRKSLAELEEGDAVERVPGPVGAGG